MPDNATATRPRTAPLHPRRVSGPTRRPVPVAPPTRGRTGAFERLARIPDHRLVDRVLRSRACIWLIGIMLGGIVAMQVSLLRLNTGISRAVKTQETLVQQNAMLQEDIAKRTAGDNVREAALAANMIDPPAGARRFLTARGSDVERAVKRIKPPSERARAIMEYGGILPGSLAEPGTSGAAVAASLGGVTGTATPTPTPTPVPTQTPPLPTPTAPLPTPVPTVAVAPQG